MVDIIVDFEIKYKDAMARVGKFKTPHGTVTTPALMPVVHHIIHHILYLKILPCLPDSML